jgi:hypothetical protein
MGHQPPAEKNKGHADGTRGMSRLFVENGEAVAAIG